MVEKIITAGAGGQGIMLMGKILAEAALRNGFNVTWFPTYGAEVRGGTAYCMIIISSSDIASPYINIADTLILMNEPSLFRFKQRIKNQGLLLVNSSLLNSQILKHKKSGNNQLYLPFTETALKLGNTKVANMVALGAYIANKRILTKQILFRTIEGIAPKQKRHLIGINKQAIEQGMRLAR